MSAGIFTTAIKNIKFIVSNAVQNFIKFDI